MNKSVVLEYISSIIVNMIVIILSTKIFANIYVENVLYLFIVSILLTILNKFLKPFLKMLFLPINIYTLGLTYPLINIFILKIISIFLGSHFILNGFLSAFFISIFISVMTLIIDYLIGREIRGEK